MFTLPIRYQHTVKLKLFFILFRYVQFDADNRAMFRKFAGFHYICKEMLLTSSTKAILAPGGTRPSSSACRLGLARMRSPALCRPANRRNFDGAALGNTPPACTPLSDGPSACSATSIVNSYELIQIDIINYYLMVSTTFKNRYNTGTPIQSTRFFFAYYKRSFGIYIYDFLRVDVLQHGLTCTVHPTCLTSSYS